MKQLSADKRRDIEAFQQWQREASGTHRPAPKQEGR